MPPPNTVPLSENIALLNNYYAARPFLSHSPPPATFSINYKGETDIEVGKLLQSGDTLELCFGNIRRTWTALSEAERRNYYINESALIVVEDAIANWKKACRSLPLNNSAPKPVESSNYAKLRARLKESYEVAVDRCRTLELHKHDAYLKPVPNWEYFDAMLTDEVLKNLSAIENPRVVLVPPAPDGYNEEIRGRLSHLLNILTSLYYKVFQTSYRPLIAGKICDIDVLEYEHPITRNPITNHQFLDIQKSFWQFWVVSGDPELDSPGEKNKSFPETGTFQDKVKFMRTQFRQSGVQGITMEVWIMLALYNLCEGTKIDTNSISLLLGHSLKINTNNCPTVAAHFRTNQTDNVIVGQVSATESNFLAPIRNGLPYTFRSGKWINPNTQ